MEPPYGIIYTKVVILGKRKGILESTMSLFSMVGPRKIWTRAVLAKDKHP